MTSIPTGFFLERIAVSGPGVVTAEVSFADGLNVVSGASDTGKSYICGLIDFAFGATKPPRIITQAARYARVAVRVRHRASGARHEVERALIGGDATLRELDAAGGVV